MFFMLGKRGEFRLRSMSSHMSAWHRSEGVPVCAQHEVGMSE